MPPRATNMSNEAIRRRLREKLNYRGQRVDGTFKTPKKGKYGARNCWVNGHFFPSMAEADRYVQLLEMQMNNTIDQLELQPAFPCRVNGVLVCTYRADFRYRVNPGRLGQRVVIEDVKGVMTPLFKLKLKLVEALHPGIGVIQIELGKKGTMERYRFLTADRIGRPDKEEAWPRMKSAGSQRSSAGSQD